MRKVALFLLFSTLRYSRAQNTVPTVDINPYKDIPGLSNVFGDSEKDFDDRWYFWVIIGFIAAVFIVAGYFTWRGFKNHRAAKEKQRLAEEEAEKQQQSARQQTIACQVDVVELARRTGRRVSSVACARPLPPLIKPQPPSISGINSPIDEDTKTTDVNKS